MKTDQRMNNSQCININILQPNYDLQIHFKKTSLVDFLNRPMIKYLGTGAANFSSS